MVCLSVCYSRVCIEINSNCIRLGQFSYEDLTGHGVCVVVHMILVIQAGQLLTKLYGLTPKSVKEFNSYDDRNFFFKADIVDEHHYIAGMEA